MVALCAGRAGLFLSFFSSGQTAVKLSGAEAADRAQCAALTNQNPTTKAKGYIRRPAGNKKL